MATVLQLHQEGVRGIFHYVCSVPDAGRLGDSSKAWR